MKKRCLIFLLAATIFAACTISKPSQVDGKRKILTARKYDGGTMVTIQGMPGRYLLPSDTIKANDSIHVSFLKRY